MSDNGNILAPVSQAGEIPSGGIMEQVAAATGRALRLAEGSQVLSADLVLSRTGPDLLEADWLFPAEAVGATQLTGSVDIGYLQTNAAPSADEIGGVHFTSLSATGATVQLRRIAGRTDFASGDTARVHLIALARWTT